jgi:hypothetical protein
MFLIGDKMKEKIRLNLEKFKNKLSFVFINNKEKLTFRVFCFYCLIVSFGSLFRIHHGVSSIGLSSILLVLIILLRLPEAISTVYKNRLLQLWFLLIVYISIIIYLRYGFKSVSDWYFSNSAPNLLYDPFDPSIWQYTKVGSLGIYLLFCGAIAGLNWNNEMILEIAKMVALGLFISGLLCSIDSLNLVDIPRINDYRLEEIRGYFPYGQFGHRSGMSLYLSIMLTFLLVMIESGMGTYRFRICCLLACCYFFWLLIISINRSGPATIVLSLCIYYIFNVKNEKRIISKRIPDFILPLCLAVMLVGIGKPNTFKLYLYRWVSSPIIANFIPVSKSLSTFAEPYGSEYFAGIDPSRSDLIYKSDMTRWELARETWWSLRKIPYGSGFVNDPHVFFVIDLIHAAGLFGIIWLIVFSSLFVSMIFKTIRTLESKSCLWAVITGIIAWFVVGIMYNSLYLGIGWGFLGMIISLSRDNMSNRLALER